MTSEQEGGCSGGAELGGSQEALQSQNETLSVENGLLRDRIAELERGNKDCTDLLSNTDISALFLDTGLRIKLFTPPAALLFNLGPEDIGRPIADVLPNLGDDRLLVDAGAVLDRLAPLEKDVAVEDGRCFLCRIQPYRAEERRIDGVVITFIDMTGRIRVEQELRGSLAKLKETNRELEESVSEHTGELARREQEVRALAANVPAMFSYVDAGEVYRYVNRLYEQHFGLSAAQMVGRRVPELMGPENYAIAKPHIDMALSGERVRYESTFTFADGVHAMDVVYVPEKDSSGRTRGFYTLVHDITERKALETRLHDSEQRLQAIVDNAGDAIITVDYEGRVQSYNPAAERIFGRSAAEVIGRDARLLLPPGCLDCADFPVCFRVGQCRRGAHRPNDLVGRRKDGALFPVEITVGDIHDLRLYVALLRDTSDCMALEREIIEISTAEQERIGREIHDGIGQQLTALTMLASSAERSLTAAQRPDEARIVAGLVSHLQDTLAQTRALARGLAPVEIDPQGLVAALSDLTEYVSRSSGVSCRFVADEVIEVGDDGLATHLYRIAQEALHNAVRHGAPRSIEVRLDQENREIILSVYDDGIGIQPTEKPTSGVGIHFMRYRAGIIGGRLTIERAAQGGTLIRCACPTVR